MGSIPILRIMMTTNWFTDIMKIGKLCILFDDITKRLTLHTEIDKNCNAISSIVQDNFNKGHNCTVREI